MERCAFLGFYSFWTHDAHLNVMGEARCFFASFITSLWDIKTWMTLMWL